MKVLFGYQVVLEVVKNGLTPLVESATVPWRTSHKEEKTKDYKELHLINQCVDAIIFEKVGGCTSSKKPWEILEKIYAGADKENVLRLQTHKRYL